MNPEEKFELIKSVGEELLGEDQLLEKLQSGKTLTAYDGFEPSGKIHIAQGLLRAINVNKLTEAGVHFKFWVADWFALMNNKLDGDLDKIQTAGKYAIEIWKACGMDMSKVEFLWASEHMTQDYWMTVVRIGTKNSVTRITRCAQIMGRSDSASLSAAQIFYPCMQAADIFHLNVDIAQLGMDQRKVNVLAREVAPKLGYDKPIALHHHMLMGLKKPQTEEGMSGADAAIAKKMSKSDPNSAIFMTDTEKQVQKKFNKAYCPEKIVEDNPVLEYLQYIVFEKYENVVIDRYEQEALSFTSYQDLEKSYVSGDIHPADLKQSTAKYINELLEPVRKHFEENSEAKALMEKVDSFTITK